MLQGRMCGFFFMLCAFIFSKRFFVRHIRFDNIHIKRIYSRTPPYKRKTAKEINTILTYLLTPYWAMQAFSSYFYHAYEQIIAVIDAKHINSCKEIINAC